jgi:hypothetical protein
MVASFYVLRLTVRMHFLSFPCVVRTRQFYAPTFDHCGNILWIITSYEAHHYAFFSALLVIYFLLCPNILFEYPGLKDRQFKSMKESFTCIQNK